MPMLADAHISRLGYLWQYLTFPSQPDRIRVIDPFSQMKREYNTI